MTQELYALWNEIKDRWPNAVAATVVVMTRERYGEFRYISNTFPLDCTRTTKTESGTHDHT